MFDFQNWRKQVKALIILIPLFLSGCSTVEKSHRGVLPPQNELQAVEEDISRQTIDAFCDQKTEGKNVIYYVRDKDGKCVMGGMR